MNPNLLVVGYGAQLLQTFGALLIVCGLAYAVLRFVSRRGMANGGQKRLQVVASTSLGPRQRIAIVRVDETEIVVGVSDQGVALLREHKSVPEHTHGDVEQSGVSRLRELMPPRVV